MDDTGTDEDHKAADDARAPDSERLEELGDRIQSVRAEAEDVVEGVADTDHDDDDDGGDTYAESGDKESTDEDDQTIAPG